MNREARAIIRWVPASRGGRRQPPSPATGYCCVPRFEDDPSFASGAWSLRIVGASEMNGPDVIDAKVSFVMPDAPHELLHEGCRFELMEGPKVVAKGVVLPQAVEPPRRMSEFELALLG